MVKIYGLNLVSIVEGFNCSSSPPHHSKERKKTNESLYLIRREFKKLKELQTAQRFGEFSCRRRDSNKSEILKKSHPIYLV